MMETEFQAEAAVDIFTDPQRKTETERSERQENLCHSERLFSVFIWIHICGYNPQNQRAACRKSAGRRGGKTKKRTVKKT